MYQNFQPVQQPGFTPGMMPGMMPNQPVMQQQMSDWPVDRFLATPSSFQFSQNNYPPVQFPLLIPEMARLVPILSATIAAEICQTAQDNTIRVYTFNQLSHNNFMNNDFVQTVQLAADMIALLIKKRTGTVPGMPIGDDIPRECKNALLIKCSLNVANSQQLASTLSQEFISQAQHVINSFRNIAPEIENLRRGGQQMQRPQAPFVHPQTQGHFQSGFQQPPQFQPNQQFQAPNQFGGFPNNNPGDPRSNYFNTGNQPRNEDVGRRQYDAPAFVPVQFVNGVPVAGTPVNMQPAAPAPAAPQPFNSYTPPSATADRFAPSAFTPNQPIVQEWNSTPPGPINCPPPPPTNLAVQANPFRIPEIRTENSFEFPEDVVQPFNNPPLEFAEEGNSVTEVPVSQGETIAWCPSELQPFHIDWDFTKEKIILKKVSYKGRFFFIQQRINLTEAEMDEARHTIGVKTLRDQAHLEVLQADRMIPADGLEEGRVVRAGPKIEQPSDNSEEKSEDTALNSTGQPVEQRTNTAFTPLMMAGLNREAIETLDDAGKPAWSDVGFLADAIYNTRVLHLKMDNSKTRICRGRYIVPKVFVSKKPLDDVYAAWVGDKSFKHLATSLRSVLKEGVTTNRSHKEFAAELDCYLTGLVNEYLRNTLQVAFIDSFCEDIETIIGGYLQNRYGQSIHNAMIGFENSFYDKYLTRILDPEILNSLKDSLGSVAENQSGSASEVHILAFEGNYTISSIRVHSSELKVTDNKGDANGMIYSIGENQSELKAFCDNLFDHPETKKYVWVKHLLLTSNGQIYTVEAPDVGHMKYTLRHFDTKCLLP